MKIVAFGNTYHLYGDDVKTYDLLPAGYYRVEYNNMSGYSIKKMDREFSVNEKVYGVSQNKVNKVLNSYKLFNRNLGVLLSGDKGIGKSMFSKMLGIACVKQGIPVISITQSTPGLAEFLEDLNQEAMFLFDEFDKTFDNGDEKESGSQSSLLTLFDGTSASSKRLFVVTCNDLYNLNDFLVNRPGRFHYHFRFDYPNADEIREYLQDKLDKSVWNQIDEVVSFAEKVNLNYDCLRSIVFEMQTGTSFVEAIKDLNIIAEDDYFNYDVTAVFNNGECITRKKQSINMYSEDLVTMYFYIGNKAIFRLEFNIDQEKYIAGIGSAYTIPIKDCEVRWFYTDKSIKEDDDEEVKEDIEFVKAFTQLYKSGLKEITIRRSKQKKLHYNINAF